MVPPLAAAMFMEFEGAVGRLRLNSDI